ncbi:MAG: hypothetical protein ACI3YX_03310 [Prevotella sp.]
MKLFDSFEQRLYGRLLLYIPLFTIGLKSVELLLQGIKIAPQGLELAIRNLELALQKLILTLQKFDYLFITIHAAKLRKKSETTKFFSHLLR